MNLIVRCTAGVFAIFGGIVDITVAAYGLSTFTHEHTEYVAVILMMVIGVAAIISGYYTASHD